MQQVIVVDDIDVYIEGGVEGSETIVMIHGWPDTYRLWDAQVEELKSRYRCVRFTLPGFDLGKSCRGVNLIQPFVRRPGSALTPWTFESKGFFLGLLTLTAWHGT